LLTLGGFTCARHWTHSCADSCAHVKLACTWAHSWAHSRLTLGSLSAHSAQLSPAVSPARCGEPSQPGSSFHVMQTSFLNFGRRAGKSHSRWLTTGLTAGLTAGLSTTHWALSGLTLGSLWAHSGLTLGSFSSEPNTLLVSLCATRPDSRATSRSNLSSWPAVSLGVCPNANRSPEHPAFGFLDL